MSKMDQKCLNILLLISCIAYVSSAPNDFVVSAKESNKEDGNKPSSETIFPNIYEMDVYSNISNRFAKTLILSKVKNANVQAKESTFTVVLPDKAFISKFVMIIDGVSYEAYVKEKKEAKKIYDQAVASGQSTGHVAVSARDSNRFTVSVNVEPESKAEFHLTYEELLERKNDQYELVLNIHPGQVVDHLNVEVKINETRPLKFVRTPSIRSGNEISKNDPDLDPSSEVTIFEKDTSVANISALVTFNPNNEKQKYFAKKLGNKESDGMSGQFVVQYDVERDPHGGEILLKDGYFVHFFAPSELKPLPKHVVFVLDKSGSMMGNKMEQLKDAMVRILSEMKESDLLSIVEFSDNVEVRDISKGVTQTIKYQWQGDNFAEPFAKLRKYNLTSPTPSTPEIIAKAKDYIKSMGIVGSTNIIGGLQTALYLTKIAKEQETQNSSHQPMIIFLTDGEANIGVSSPDEITKLVTNLNKANNKVPIFSLSFGFGADRRFLRDISLKNYGFSRHIYEDSDASLQLQKFYEEISSPLLNNIEFKYDSDVTETTKKVYPIYFRGSEIVVAGRYDQSKDGTPKVAIDCFGTGGYLDLVPKFETPVSPLERLWAYLTVKQTLDEMHSADNKTVLKKKALDLALKYSFVTEITSLVVVKPNATNAVETENAHKTSRSSSYYRPAGASGRQWPSYGYHSGQYLRFGDTYGRSSGYAGGLSAFRSSGYAANLPVSRKTFVQTPNRTLRDDLPWLGLALNNNNTLTLPNGTFELGENISIPMPNVECNNTPPINTNSTGFCSLLKNCPQAHPYLISFQDYQKYFCPIENKYAGVCCLPQKHNFK